MKKCISFLIIAFSLIKTIQAQHAISGTIQEGKTKVALSGASVALLMLPDSSLYASAMSDDTGRFTFLNVKSGLYLLHITYLGYINSDKNLTVSSADISLGILKLTTLDRVLKQVDVTGYQARAEQKGDTTQYNANAFKTQPDATAEDLVTKMPGITSENGTLKAQGQEVKKVLVDGKPFFGDDVNLAMKNLSAEVVDKVQMYQGASDQAAFTGFDDGNAQQTLNIITKQNKRNGIFGKVYGGAGYITDLRYSAGFSINWLHKNMRLSAIGMANNINQQNFSFQDILGVTNTQAPQFAGMFGGGPPPGAPKGPPPGGANSGPGANVANFLTTQQTGIASTYATGLNYSDIWGKKEKVSVSGSYFFNYAESRNTSELTRKYYSNTDTAQYYTEQAYKTARNMNHRANLRLQYVIDSNNSLIFTPSFTYQNSKQSSNTNAQNSYNLVEQLNFLNNQTSTSNQGYNISIDALYRHKFAKRGRTLTIGLNGKHNAAETNSEIHADVITPPNDTAITDQESTTLNGGYTIGGNITYTEPIGEYNNLQFSYTPSITWSKADKKTYTPDNSGKYIVADSTLTNSFASNYHTQKAGAVYMFNKSKINLSVGADFQYALLTGQEKVTAGTESKESFYSILPNARINYSISNAANIRLTYRSSTTAPSVNQLQNVVDNSSPTQLTVGNPNLGQSQTHSGIADFRYTNIKRGQTLFGMLNINYTDDYIGKSQYTATSDTIVQQTITLASGSQLTTPINLKNYWSVNTFLAYGIPLSMIKCNLNLNAGLNFSSTPGLINGAINTSNTYAANGGFFLGSNISEKIDFSLNYFSTYNIVRNSLQKAANNNYFTHNAGLTANWMFWKGFVANTSLQNMFYNGISSGYNQNVFLWNASIGYKFLKDKSLELKVAVNDMLNQNAGISRSVTETYVEDSKNTALKRHMLITITYNLKAFKK